jgi:CelD/BcsL family acetyltransferase involved in cellulose biosynthesis
MRWLKLPEPGKRLQCNSAERFICFAIVMELSEAVKRESCTVDSEYTITVETFETLVAHWRATANSLTWNCLFTLPPWLKACWSVFSSGWEHHICAVRQHDKLIGIAPLMLGNNEARFIGNTDVCDFLDCIITPGEEKAFFRNLISHLRQQGIGHLVLGHVRSDSSVFIHLPAVAEAMGCAALCIPEDVVLELQLPATWEGFLLLLSGKERHEIRRKLRRLEESRKIRYRTLNEQGAVELELTTFFDLFRLNRSDKASFMTGQMEMFFHAIAGALSAEHILKLGFLELDSQPVAAVMCFDYNSTRYLYNNAYDSQFSSLSVGLLSKAFSIQDSIDKGMAKYDFLKGAEEYKQRLGGIPLPLYTCRVNL